MSNQTFLIKDNNSEKLRDGVYTLGFISTLLVILGTIIDIVAGSLLSGDLTQIPQTAVERFSQFHDSWLLGLYNLDMLNLITTSIMIATYYALYISHRHLHSDYVKFAFLVFIIAAAIFITNNSALAMLDLSQKYFATNDVTQKSLYAAAGEAMLARGAHGSAGAFLGFVLSSIASILMSIGMFKGKVFGKVTSYCGIIGGILLLIYLILVTFDQNARGIAMIISAPGGILSLIWMILFATKLYKLRYQAETVKKVA